MEFLQGMNLLWLKQLPGYDSDRNPAPRVRTKRTKRVAVSTPPVTRDPSIAGSDQMSDLTIEQDSKSSAKSKSSVESVITIRAEKIAIYLGATENCDTDSLQFMIAMPESLDIFKKSGHYKVISPTKDAKARFKACQATNPKTLSYAAYSHAVQFVVFCMYKLPRERFVPSAGFQKLIDPVYAHLEFHLNINTQLF